MASYVAAYRIGMLVSTAGALFLVSGFEGRLRARHRLDRGLSRDGAFVLIGIATTLIATEPEKSAAARPSTPRTRRNPLDAVIDAAIGAFSDFLTRDMAFVVLAFVVLFKFTDAFAGAMTAPFVIDLGFTRNEYAAIIKGVGFAATLIGGFAGGFVARAYPLATSLWIGGILQAVANLAFSWQAMVGDNAALAHVRDHGGEFHQRDRHGDLRRLPLGAVPQSAAHRDAIRAADRARRGRAHLSLGRRRAIVAAATGWAWFFAICALAAIPSLVLLAWLQARGHFEDEARRCAEELARHTASCDRRRQRASRRDSRARRRPARRARAASPSRSASRNRSVM